MKRHKTLLDQQQCLMMVIDIQEKFVPHINEMNRVVSRSGKLIDAINLLNIPVIVTEQYPTGLGPTCQDIKSHLTNKTQIIAKTSFSCCQEEAISSAIKAHHRQQIILCGIETHVCVAQTAMDLIENGYQVTIATDTVSSRDPFETAIALSRLSQTNISLSTTESICMELCVSSNHSAFKEISGLIKQT